MSIWAGIFILLGVPLSCLVLGAWLGERLGLVSPSQRVAASLLAGLGVLLVALALINLVLPLRGWTIALVASPALLTLSSPARLRRLWHDLGATLLTRGGAAFAGGMVAYQILLLWPLLSGDRVVFYDGTSNHDAYFWITGADHLQQHDYLTTPGQDSFHPAMNYVSAITGWRPLWGRMGAEGYLAAVASASGLTPLTAYLWASAALFTAWVAAVYLVVRTFVTEELHWPAAAALAAFQPLFAFYHHNANLPNLVGMLAGATLVVAVEGACRAANNRPVLQAWATLGAFAAHGLLCSYPEMAPFVALPCGLLLLRQARAPHAIALWAWVAGAILAMLLLSPATSLRAFHGFVISFEVARANENWANMFSSSGPGEFFPALLTLSAKFGREVGDVGGAILTTAALALLASTWWRARDRVGMTCIMTGALALALYTGLTGFHYGWQKTVQFSAVFFAALLPVGAVERATATGSRRGYVAGAAIFGVFIYIAVIVQLDLLKWSGRKMIRSDWLELASAAPRTTKERPLVVDAATFQHSFFHGMWAAYFLSEQPIVYAARGRENGGYLRLTVAHEDESVPNAGVLVGRAWRENFNPHATVLARGQEFALLSAPTRVWEFNGHDPVSGFPRSVAATFSMLVQPNEACQLDVALSAPPGGMHGSWRVTRESEGVPVERYALEETTRAWRGRVPLEPGKRQRVRFVFEPANGATSRDAAFAVDRLQIVTSAR